MRAAQFPELTGEFVSTRQFVRIALARQKHGPLFGERGQQFIEMSSQAARFFFGINTGVLRRPVVVLIPVAPKT